jgi:erythronate-4-phosphate dehydrogenase
MNVLTDKNIPLIFEALNSKSSVVVLPATEINREQLKNNSINHLFIRSTVKANEKLLEGTNVVFIATATSGIDHLDLEYLKKKGIAYFSAAGSNANSVAEYVIYSILKWSLLDGFSRLKSKTIGIIGFGNIGKIVAQYCNLLGLKVLVNDPPLLDMNFQFPDYVTYCELDELFKNSDIITNHVPLTLSGIYKTKYLINYQQLNLMRSNSLFIHTSRGGVVDEKALSEILTKKQLFLAIDVWENEPDFNVNLASVALIATPHLAGYAYDAKIKGSIQVLKHFENFTNITPDYKLLLNELQTNNIEIIKNFDDVSKVFQILKTKRCFENDYEIFKATFGLSIDKRKQFFIDFRKNYPIRRESIVLNNI